MFRWFSLLRRWVVGAHHDNWLVCPAPVCLCRSRDSETELPVWGAQGPVRARRPGRHLWAVIYSFTPQCAMWWRAVTDQLITGLRPPQVDTTQQLASKCRGLSAAFFCSIIVSVKTTSGTVVYANCWIENLTKQIVNWLINCQYFNSASSYLFQ